MSRQQTRMQGLTRRDTAIRPTVAFGSSKGQHNAAVNRVKRRHFTHPAQRVYAQITAENGLKAIPSLSEKLALGVLHVDLESMNQDLLQGVCKLLQNCEEAELLEIQVSRGAQQSHRRKRYMKENTVNGTLAPKDVLVLCKSLASALKVGKLITRLTLSGLCLTSKSCKAVGEGIRSARSLQFFSINGSKCGDQLFGIIAKAVADNKSINEFCARDCALTDKSSAFVTCVVRKHCQHRNDERWSMSLRDNSRMTSMISLQGILVFDLSQNQFGDETAVDLAHALMFDDWIAAVNLSNNSIGRKGTNAFLDMICTNNSKISVINLRSNRSSASREILRLDGLLASRGDTQSGGSLSTHTQNLEAIEIIANALMSWDCGHQLSESSRQLVANVVSSQHRGELATRRSGYRHPSPQPTRSQYELSTHTSHEPGKDLAWNLNDLVHYSNWDRLNFVDHESARDENNKGDNVFGSRKLRQVYDNNNGVNQKLQRSELDSVLDYFTLPEEQSGEYRNVEEIDSFESGSATIPTEAQDDCEGNSNEAVQDKLAASASSQVSSYSTQFILAFKKELKRSIYRAAENVENEKVSKVLLETWSAMDNLIPSHPELNVSPHAAPTHRSNGMGSRRNIRRSPRRKPRTSAHIQSNSNRRKSDNVSPMSRSTLSMRSQPQPQTKPAWGSRSVSSSPRKKSANVRRRELRARSTRKLSANSNVSTIDDEAMSKLSSLLSRLDVEKNEQAQSQLGSIDPFDSGSLPDNDSMCKNFLDLDLRRPLHGGGSAHNSPKKSSATKRAKNRDVTTLRVDHEEVSAIASKVSDRLRTLWNISS